MIAVVRLFVALVATAMVACPVMASDIRHHGDVMETVALASALPAHHGVEAPHSNAAGSDTMGNSCPERIDCSITAINQVPPAPFVSPFVDEGTLIAIPAVEISLQEVIIKGFATGPPSRLYVPRPRTLLVLRQRFLI